MDTLTIHEIIAYQLLRGCGGSSNVSVQDYHKAANDIIILAEKIKAERAIAAMNPFVNIV